MEDAQVKRSSFRMKKTKESHKKIRLDDTGQNPKPEVESPQAMPTAPRIFGESIVVDERIVGYDEVDEKFAVDTIAVTETVPMSDERIEATMEVDDFDVVDEKFECLARTEAATQVVDGDEDDIASQSELFRHLSDKLMSFDQDDIEVDGDMDQTDGFNALAYLRDVADETRLLVATYLSTGSLKDVILSNDNVHHVYHVAVGLNLKRLRKHCHSFCAQGDMGAIHVAFLGCSCYSDFKAECDATLTRSESIISNSDDSTPPEFYVVFTCDENVSEKQEKVKVVVIDMSERAKVLHRRIKKPFQFPSGFRTCGCDIDQSPYVFFSGGAGKTSDVMWKYDVIGGDWKKSAKLLHGRSKHAMVAANDRKIFVLGGQEVPCIEEYDIASNKWKERGSLLTHVDSCMCAIYGSIIFLFGGKTASGPVSTIQSYEMVTHKVEKLPDLPCPMYGGQTVVYGDKIYIASGQGHMAVFDPRSCGSELRAMQPVVRTDFGMFVRNERIYLVGGVLPAADRTSEATPQYRYNPVKDDWVEKYKLCDCLKVLSASIVRYPKYCPIVPFNDQF